MLNSEDIEKWVDNNLNVMLVGKYGIGKTARILQIFKDKGLKYKYFSGASMDPWVDFIGIPKEMEENGKRYLELVKPKEFANDEVEALFIDEYSRAPKAVRNAVMELIQFKSINGKKFNNLRIVWTAINPSDENYDVDKLDPAQQDRFHIIMEVPYECDLEYFEKKYGEMGKNAVAWWNDLNKEEKEKVSPRRLDYCLELFDKGINLRHILPKGINVSKLVNELSSGPISVRLEKIFNSKDEEAAKKILASENNVNACIEFLRKTNSRPMTSFFYKFFPRETISSLMSDTNKVFLQAVFDDEAPYKEIVREKVKMLKSLTTRDQDQEKTLALLDPIFAYSVSDLLVSCKSKEDKIELLTVVGESHDGTDFYELDECTDEEMKAFVEVAAELVWSSNKTTFNKITNIDKLVERITSHPYFASVAKKLSPQDRVEDVKAHLLSKVK